MKKSVGVCWEGSRLQTHGNMVHTLGPIKNTATLISLSHYRGDEKVNQTPTPGETTT